MPSRRVVLAMGSDPKKAEAYAAALRYVGLEPLLNPDSLQSIDGILLGGGTDVNPKLYGEPRGKETEQPDDERDAREIHLLKKAELADLPVLAICRGMQLLNVARQGTLVQHIGDSHRRKGVADAHPIRIDPDSQLANILEAEELKVNSRHHQAICHIGRDLQVSAWCPADDIVEGVEDPSRRFVIGVQWHPEDRIATHPGDQRLFRAFARAIAENKR